MIKVIYTIFLGLLLALFVGVTVSTFYPAPEYPEYPSSLEGRPFISGETPPVGTTETAEEKADREAFEVARDQYQKDVDTYNRNVFIIVLVCSVVLLILSLAFMKQIAILADGLLLGGALTLLYAIARGLMSDESMVRFIVVLIGLIIVMIIGYVKFIHPEKKSAKS